MKEENYSSRAFEVIKIKDIGPEILHPESLLLSLPNSSRAKPIDIGALCFSKRSPRKAGWNTNKKNQSLPVVLDSFLVHRREFIIRYLDKIAVSGLRPESINSELIATFRIFDWMDTNNHSNFLLNETLSEKAYVEFTDYLYHQIQNGKLGVNTAAKRQNILITHIIGCMFQDAGHKIKAKTYNIKEQRKINRAPSKSDLSEYLFYLVPFIRELRKALMNEDFPLKIKAEHLDLRIFHTFFSDLHNPALNKKNAKNYGIFELETGRQLSFEEFATYKSLQDNFSSLKSNNLSALKNEYMRSLKSLDKSNIDRKRSYFRVLWAQKVIRGYAQLIQIITGMNTSQLIRLRYDDALEISRSNVKKDLITIKYRASGQVQFYPIGGVKGLQILKEYLEFRDWILDGDKCDLLFFTNLEISKRIDSPSPLQNGFQFRLFQQLSGKLFPPHIKNISSTAARKYKSIALEYIGASNAEVADLLNHSVETNEKSYGAPSLDDSKQELSQFWSSVRKSASKIRIEASSRYVANQNITVGHCNNLGNPLAIDEKEVITPNCQTQFGCLYCEHYACHADTEDIRKLLNLKYVTKLLREQADDVEIADSLFKGLYLKIEALLERITELYPEMADSIRNIHEEVFDLGILNPFWESRVSRYEEMGVLI